TSDAGLPPPRREATGKADPARSRRSRRRRPRRGSTGGVAETRRVPRAVTSSGGWSRLEIDLHRALEGGRDRLPRGRASRGGPPRLGVLVAPGVGVVELVEGLPEGLHARETIGGSLLEAAQDHRGEVARGRAL